MRSTTLILGFLWVFLVATSQEEDAIEATEAFKAMKEIMAIKQKYGLSPRKARDLMDLLPSYSKEFQTLLPVQVDLAGIVDHLKREFGQNITALQTKIEQLEEEVESLKENRPSPTTDGGRPLPKTVEPTVGVLKSEMEKELEAGGWKLIQMKKKRDVNFETRGWDDYKNGFGRPGLSSTFYWRGLEWLYTKTKCGKWQIKLLWRYPKEEGNFRKPEHFEVYDDFKIDSEDVSYRLNLGERVNVTDGRSIEGGFYYNNGHMFAVNDRKCRFYTRAGWWFNNCYYICLNCNYGEVDFSKETSETYMAIREVSGDENCN